MKNVHNIIMWDCGEVDIIEFRMGLNKVNMAIENLDDLGFV